MKKFNSSSYVKSKFNTYFILNLSSLVVGIIPIVYFITSLDENHNEDTKMLLYFLIVLLSLLCFYNIFNVFKSSTRQNNLLKNYLEINENYISGIYVDTPNIPDSDKYFKIEINQIEKVEIKEPKFLMNEFHNLYIYHSNGLIKLAIELPDQAQKLLLGKSNDITNQHYSCSCGNFVCFGQEKCEKCGTKFDWTKL